MARNSNAADAGVYTIGLLVGILLGAICVALIVLAITAESFKGFVYDYQALIGSIIALIGALAAALAILLQIRRTEALAYEERERRGSAARTLMPGALTTVARYAEDCVRLLMAIRPPGTAELDNPIPSNPPLNIQPLPSLPRESTLDLRECVESAPEDVQSAILELVALLQIQSSRLRSVHMALSGQAVFLWPNVSPCDLDKRVIEALEVHARSSALLDYARKRSEHANETLDLYSAAHNNNIEKTDYPNIYVLVDQFKPYWS